jgi:hypothetical protein
MREHLRVFVKAIGVISLILFSIMIFDMGQVVGSSAASGTATPAATLAGTTYFLPLIEDNPTPLPAPVPISGLGDPVVNALGDIAACDPSYIHRDGQMLTEALMRTLDGPILGLGDYVYPDGTPAYFTSCFDPVWSSIKTRFIPAAGNHEYQYTNAGGYYSYFGAAAGDPTQGYYSFNLGSWHLIALNSNCSAVGGCGVGSQQLSWLQADLGANTQKCILAYWHHPLYGSGLEGNTPEVLDFWQALYAAHATLVINGHNHDYERFGPMDPVGNPDPLSGITEIVSGTGGKDHSPLTKLQPNSRVFNDTDFGVLRLALHADSYEWQFLPVAGGTFTDGGSGKCN